ncbi:MAG: HAD family hydrolase [Bacillus sp. (in: firmicutes)]
MNYIFDFDGTIADSKLCSILATQDAFKACNLKTPSKDQIAHYMGVPIEQSFKEMANSPLTDEAFEQLLISFRSFYKQYENKTLQLFPEMKVILQQLKEQQLNCFVVSSKKTDVLKRNLATLRIASFFKDYIGSDQVKNYKPHPEGIFKLIERYQLDTSSCMMIGDAIFDIQMGKAANCHTCAVTWGSHSKDLLASEKPDYIIENVYELLRFGMR